GSLVRTSTRLRWLATSMAVGVVAVSVAALATRLAPDRFPTSIPAIGESNLAYPLTYSNALGVLCVPGAILCLDFVTSVRASLVALAVDAPAKVSDQYDRFVKTGQASPTEDLRQSVFSSANRGLVDNWKVALDALSDRPLTGQGAGAYELFWNEHRPAKQASYN